MKIVAKSFWSGARPARLRASGFTLLELALVLLVLGLLAFVFLPPSLALMDQKRRNDTRARLQALDEALARFAMVNGRLPCPANGALGVDGAQSGLEQRTDAASGQCANTALQNGVVPWRTLGVGSGLAIDAWGSLVTYRVWAAAASGPQASVQTALTKDGGLDMHACDPAGGGSPASGAELAMPGYRCAAGAPASPGSAPLAYLTAKRNSDSPNPPSLHARGFRICGDLPCPLTQAPPAAAGGNERARRVDGNGAAYVLISHGANRYGAFSTTGQLAHTATGPGPGAREAVNANGLAMRWTGPAPDPNPTVDNTFYIDADYDESESRYFDDLVSRPGVMAVAIAAGLGPRAR